MMSSLFSVFDPSTDIMSLPLNWISTCIGLMIMPTTFWLIPSRCIFVWDKITSTLHKEFKVLVGPIKNPGVTLTLISLFAFILFNNFLGLFPYIFTSSSHLVMTLALSLPLWMTFMIYGWFNYTQHMLAHLVPQGTPSLLMPFMVLIETTSNLIRPGTLAIRLAANMIAGHLLITLLGSTGPMLSMSSTILLTITQIALLLLELAVSIIQAYVFAVLTTLYLSEI
uniref:ATP synthase subunit a n=1 Tax=Holochlora fruhstorferi TaxID=1945530 RepID=A0A1Q1MPR7_9ORTH|nr:ATP synthase F0 subunit 6 [Holochlora fruhstorferi]AQM40087.1 ATP synthase F0 subunit 6 [Holochlora fruhstorferi]